MTTSALIWLTFAAVCVGWCSGTAKTMKYGSLHLTVEPFFETGPDRDLYSETDSATHTIRSLAFSSSTMNISRKLCWESGDVPLEMGLKDFGVGKQSLHMCILPEDLYADGALLMGSVAFRHESLSPLGGVLAMDCFREFGISATTPTKHYGVHRGNCFNFSLAPRGDQTDPSGGIRRVGPAPFEKSILLRVLSRETNLDSLERYLVLSVYG